jgi:integrase
MPRQVNDATLQNRTSRGKLKVGGKPHYREIDPGRHLGYRRLKTGGKWTVRVYAGDGKYLTETLAIADDHTDADGKMILDFAQAQKLARKRATEILAAAEGLHIGPYTVQHAIDDYLTHLGEDGGRDGPEVRRRVGTIGEILGDIKLSALKDTQVKKWRNSIANSPPKLRNGKPKPVDMTDPEVLRRRKDTANRQLNDLKAAFNLAIQNKKTATDAAWRTVKPYKGVSSPRIRYLSLNEATRLLNAAAPDLRTMINGALLTGARISDLCRMTVGDFMPDAGCVMVQNKKSQYKGKSAFPCYLSAEGMEFFAAHTAGREPGQPMFTRANGEAFTRHVKRQMDATNEAARLNPPASFHVLRHTYASQAVMAGVPLMVIAKNLGHSDTRMVEKHYGHLAPSFVRDAIMAGLPTWGVKADVNVTSLMVAR